MKERVQVSGGAVSVPLPLTLYVTLACPGREFTLSALLAVDFPCSGWLNARASSAFPTMRQLKETKSQLHRAPELFEKC